VKKTLVLALILTGLALSWGCVSFKIKGILPAENQVEYIYVCKDVRESGGLAVPLEIQFQFKFSDGKIVCFVKMLEVDEEMTLSWRWYESEGRLLRDHRITVNSAKRFMETVTAYDELVFADLEREPAGGEWRVAVFLDGVLAGSRVFAIN